MKLKEYYLDQVNAILDFLMVIGIVHVIVYNSTSSLSQTLWNIVFIVVEVFGGWNLLKNAHNAFKSR